MMKHLSRFKNMEKIINNYKIHFMNDYLTYIMIDEGRITGSERI